MVSQQKNWNQRRKCGAQKDAGANRAEPANVDVSNLEAFKPWLHYKREGLYTNVSSATVITTYDKVRSLLVLKIH